MDFETVRTGKAALLDRPLGHKWTYVEDDDARDLEWLVTGSVPVEEDSLQRLLYQGGLWSSGAHVDANLPSATQDPTLRGTFNEPYIRRLFECLAEYWKDQTQFESSLEAIFGHPAVELIVELGRSVFPLALEHAENEPERWSYILSRITGSQPLPSGARREDAARIWSEWGRIEGWI